MKHVIISVICFFIVCGAVANDTLQFLSVSEFINIVRRYHPVARQADLAVEMAQARLSASRAGFDPRFYVYTDRKTFDGKNYYDVFNPELKIPTWFGIEVKAGLENNLGDYLNPETTQGKSSYLGLSVPIGKNLLMDRRRAVLQQAKIFNSQSRSERLLTINDLLMDAYSSYWTWVKYYETYRILEQAVRVNEERFRLVKLGFRQGDRPAIDTTEALTQLQSFQMASAEAWLDFRKSGLELSNYLWTSNDSPYDLPEHVVPDSSWQNADSFRADLPALDSLITLARNSHPKLDIYEFKLQALDVEKRYKFQDLLPTLNIRYNILNSGYNVFNDASAALYRNNYKFGVDFGMPLFLSQGRGDYKAAKLKIRETNLDLVQLKLSIDNKVRYFFNELVTLQNQLRIAESSLENYRKLYQGENNRFAAGESSLFLLNSRENKVLESTKKLVELRARFFTSLQSARWAAGQLR